MNKNVIPTLPPHNQPQRPQRSQNNKPSGNGVNVKAIIILVVIAVGIIVLISVRSCVPAGTNSEPESIIYSEPIVSDVVSITPTPPEPPTPEENSGTEIPLVSGAIYRDIDKFVLASDVVFTETKSVADVSLISLNESLTVKPNATCTYDFEPNTIIITHNTGSLISITRAKYAGVETPTSEQFDTLLSGHAEANGVEKPVYGNLYLGTTLRGRYVTGIVTPAGDVEPKTFLLCYFYGDPEIYTITALYNSDDAFNVLLNSISWNKSTIQLN